ncbi:MAG: cell envelope integrity protein TolA [Planctomycetes bacterium]|nr:cell envelope integrity protein TolA [Planctomycetota bacterium]
MNALWDKTYDVEAAKQMAEDATRRDVQRIEIEKQKALAESEQKHDADLARIGSEHLAEMQAIEDEARSSHEARRQRYAAELQASQDALTKARQEWKDAIAEASEKRKAAEADDEGPGKLGQPSGLLDRIKEQLTLTGAALQNASPNWSFSIWCKNELIWAGEKTSGTTPEGQYQRTNGCDSSTGSITLVGIPELELNGCLPGSFSNTYNISIVGTCCSGPAGVCGGTVTRVSESVWTTTAGTYGFELRLESARGGFGGWDITIWDTQDPPNLFGLFLPDDYTMPWPRCDPRGLYLGQLGDLCTGDWMVDNHAIVS